MATPMTKEQYIEAILELLYSCNDLDSLDLLFRIACRTVVTD
jgi:hypothetical protein